uniref:Uncharacterized protein n=1 Tax=Ditylenchus dipsaci TaxID=166011 RepID=A0A915EJI6_9BILA
MIFLPVQLTISEQVNCFDKKRKTMDANNFLRDGRLSMNAIGQAMGMDQQALMELVQIALNQLQCFLQWSSQPF